MTKSVAAALANLLPAVPGPLLLLGGKLDVCVADLAAQGYQVSQQRICAPPDDVQYPSAARSGIAQLTLSPVTLACGPFAAVLVLDFSPAVHPLALFDQLADQLTENGLVFLTGQQPADQVPRLAHWLDYAVAIARRCGFSPQLPAQTAGSAEGGFFVRVLRKASAARWPVSHVRSADFSAIATLFHQVFGHPLSRELWDWKYATGRGNAVVASRNGALIAHYGGIYRDVLLQGKPDWVFQICDVMVHPGERGVLTRQGPFLLTAATSAEIYGPLGFGFPNMRAMRVAEKMGLYSEVGQLAEVRWQPPASLRARLRTRLRPLHSGSAPDGALVNHLWDGMALDLRGGVVGVRDWAYLEHRYLGHPHNHYEVLAVTSRLTGRPLGVMVLHRQKDACELMDVIAPLANLPLVIEQARRLTGRWGLPSLYCWISKNHLQRFLNCEGGKEEVLNVTIPTSCWTDDPRAKSFNDKWWLMSGDTDFR